VKELLLDPGSRDWLDEDLEVTFPAVKEKYSCGSKKLLFSLIGRWHGV
jgi:hypothetical protein